MELETWWRTVKPRKEVREGRSFNPDEFAIALEQVVAGTAPEDYRDPEKFFARTCFTRALNEHVGMVLRRLSGQTTNTAPVLTLITQFGGGKTHTLTTLYHLARGGASASAWPGVKELLALNGLLEVPKARVAVFVGNAWDPREGRESPWIDIARQLAGDAGVAALGSEARTTPPGTESLTRMFHAAGGPVLLLFDELLNFIGRHRNMAELFFDFIQNVTVAMTGLPGSAAMLSLPRSQVEMTDWHLEWQQKITRVVRRVAKDLIANDEAEIGEVVRRRLFEDLGNDRTRKKVAKAYAEWCFSRRSDLPPEWTAVDTAVTSAKARELLQERFEKWYPFHPATLSVFHRKWQALPQYQQTRGTLAMLAQWISWAYRDGFTNAREEALITLGSAPLHEPSFQSVVLGQLGESKLLSAIETDIAGTKAHARALDADTKGPLREIHRRVGAAILFESSGGQTDKVAHLPELRFALGEPELDTTSIDTAAATLANKAYYIRRLGTDGFKIHHQATLKKVVNDRRASLDEAAYVRPQMRKLIQEEFDRGKTLPILHFPSDGAAVNDSPKLTLLTLDPEHEWTDKSSTRERFAQWTRQRGTTDRLYPASLLWCLKKPGKDLQDKVETWLAWKAVESEIKQKTLDIELDDTQRDRVLIDVRAEIRTAEQEARSEVWASYRHIVLLDPNEKDGLRCIDMGAGHSSSGQTLCGQVIDAIKSAGLLNDAPGAGYLDRRWPPALKESGAWSLLSLRQAFLTGALERLLDVDAYLREKLPGFIERGEFGLASGHQPNGTYERLWWKEPIDPADVAFESDVFLLKKSKAQELKEAAKAPTAAPPAPPSPPPSDGDNIVVTGGAEKPAPPKSPSGDAPTKPGTQRITLNGTLPPEVWNRLGTKLIPKLKAGSDLELRIQFALRVNSDLAPSLVSELEQILDDLQIGDRVSVSDE